MLWWLNSMDFYWNSVSLMMDYSKEVAFGHYKVLLLLYSIILLLHHLCERNLTCRFLLWLPSSQIEGYWEYNKFYEEGVYNCAGCATPLYKSSTKFDSGYGWPAFFEGLLGAINRSPDPYRRRTEITCAACGGHLGHVFKGEGFKTPTDERHCVNSVSVDAERAYHRNALVILEKLYTEILDSGEHVL
ncbi:peptide methionine sulfoxide reductase B5 [Arachis duranensis]|uniref:Peptide methionine sulfoxide reductase B5 n=1 Tax=Arachis duranensis TaxID=130453 RepID=A0A9C6TRV4_ARADU|nr:peptide methionine sulfoxide reductase B5 [Arachis duranensis]